ncbi:hypothetical protein RMATCC62417_14849 [Rhizopus microsporus]|nr:hypothetical protein RMATCC62417_14849 [Rhizopus microsporus]
MKVVITGASGLLGRQVVKAFKDWEVVGTAFSRAKDNLVKLDLTDKDAVETFFNKQQPNVVVHCAAERRPDVAEKDKDGVLLLNVESSKRLATIYYVFDGTSPPYEIGDKPNPLQFYGQTKLAGENAVRQVYPNAVILRVPILYGETEYNGESAVNVLIDVVLTPQKPVKMDNISYKW